MLPYVLSRAYKPRGLSVSHFLGSRISFPLHAHSYAQLTWPRAGSVRLLQEGEQCLLRPGWIGLTDSDVSHALEISGRPRADVVFYSLSRVLFQRLAADVRRELAGNERLATCSTVRVNEATWQLLSSVLEEAYNPGPASETLVRAAIEQCVIALLRPPKAPARAATAPRHDARLSRAISYMENHLDEELSLRQLAAIASLSRYHFSRRFQEQYGISPHRYLVHLRVKRAALLLQSSDLNVTEIALEVGYDSPGNFIRHFRERFGVTPLAYRRRPRPARFV